MHTRHPFDTATFKLIYVNPADPAVGTGCTIPLPTSGRIEIVSAFFWFQAANAGGNRIPHVGLRTAADLVYQWLPPRQQALNSLIRYSCGRGEPQEPAVAPCVGHSKISLGVGMIFDNLSVMVIDAEAIDPGDQFSGIHVFYKHWIQGTFPA